MDVTEGKTSPGEIDKAQGEMAKDLEAAFNVALEAVLKEIENAVAEEKDFDAIVKRVLEKI